jgi:hypothetical protein
VDPYFYQFKKKKKRKAKAVEDAAAGVTPDYVSCRSCSGTGVVWG